MILGIDLGTSGLKCVIANYSEEIIHSTSVKLEINQFDGNCFEQKPDDWILALETCFNNLKQQDINFLEINAISFSAQMLGCIILDEYDKPIRPAILWNDGRSSEESEYLESVLGLLLNNKILSANSLESICIGLINSLLIGSTTYSGSGKAFRELESKTDLVGLINSPVM